MVSGSGEAAGVEVVGGDAFFLVEDGGGLVGGAVVDDDDFEVGVVDVAAGIEAADEAVLAVASADDDGEFGGIFGEGGGEGEVSES